MQFIKYLNEKKLTTKEIVAIIERDCGQFLKEGVVLYRGYKSLDKFLVKSPRTDRQPLNTPEIVHKALDEAFKKKFGWKARSEGVFATPNKLSTLFYGRLYYIFPVDGYKYLWSPKVGDLFGQLDSTIFEFLSSNPDYHKWRALTLNKLAKEAGEDVIKEFIDWGLDRNINTYTNKNLKMNERDEVMIKCKKYYLVHEDYINYTAKKGLEI